MHPGSSSSWCQTRAHLIVEARAAAHADEVQAKKGTLGIEGSRMAFLTEKAVAHTSFLEQGWQRHAHH